MTQNGETTLQKCEAIEIKITAFESSDQERSAKFAELEAKIDELKTSSSLDQEKHEHKEIAADPAPLVSVPDKNGISDLQEKLK